MAGFRVASEGRIKALGSTAQKSSPRNSGRTPRNSASFLIALLLTALADREAKQRDATRLCHTSQIICC
jgi:hypothetical protein